MHESLTEESTDVVKNIISWASISYGIGFAIVMLHTGRLGFPVLELISAIYIWIGIPVTIVVYIASRIGKHFYERSIEIANQAKQSWSEMFDELDESDLSSLSQFTGAFTYIPILGLFQTFLTGVIEHLTKVIERAVAKSSEDMAQENTTKEEKAKSAWKWIRRITGFMRIAKAVDSALRIFFYTLITIFMVYAYVWVLYPQIPQKYGGGAPLAARLIVDTEKIPNSTPSLGIKKLAENDKTKAQITSNLKILYITKAQIFVETQTGERISLSRGAVNGVVWLFKNERILNIGT
jgi:hypothetical protein